MKIKTKFRINKSELSDKLISLAIMSTYITLIIQYFLLVYFNFNVVLGNYIQLISKLIIGIFFVLGLPFVLKRSKKSIFIIYSLYIIIFSINTLFFKENLSQIVNIGLNLGIYGIPFFIYAYSIRDLNIFLKIVEKAALIVFIFGSMISLLVFFGFKNIGTYSMSLSYYMLLPLIIYTNKIIKKFKFRHILMILISFISIISLGSRGALMCFFAFLFYKFIKIDKKITQKRLIIYIISFMTAIIILLFNNFILQSLYNLLLKFNIDSRTLRLLLKGGIHLSGREEIYSSTIELIYENPLFGLGLGGIRRVLDIGYPHNIFLEIVSQFGVIIGICIIFILLFILYKALFIKDIEKANIIGIWFSLGFVPLLVSGSYLESFKFWILLGLSFNFLLKGTKINIKI